MHSKDSTLRKVQRITRNFDDITSLGRIGMERLLELIEVLLLYHMIWLLITSYWLQPEAFYE